MNKLIEPLMKMVPCVPVRQNIKNSLRFDDKGFLRDRLFAVILLRTKQYKVTRGDLIAVYGPMPTVQGDRINIEKILLVGSSTFTVIGRPIVNNAFVQVHATVVERTLSPVKISYNYKPRKRYHRMTLKRDDVTLIRIDDVTLNLDQIPKVSE
ncbi:hypothetical protein ACOME3_003267 [Neoechinorhynchus agilis]